VVDSKVLREAMIATPAQAGDAEAAAKAFADGQALLAQAKFDEALPTFKTAASADTANQDYQQTYALLRQIIQLRQQIQTERAPERWITMAKALRTFYHDQKLYSESLLLDRRMHERRLVPNSADLLAETLLALGKDEETVDVLRGVPEKNKGPRTVVMLGLALARQGRIDDGKALARQAAVGKDSEPQVHYDLARLHALTGDSRAASKSLKRSFERTPPSRLDTFKAEAKGCADFKVISDSSRFAAAFKAKSKIKESPCSKGAGCSKCPKRAKCGTKTATKQAAKP